MAESSDIHINLCGQFGYQNVYVHTSKVLGTGSYGSVVKATLDNRPCAAKILHTIFFRSNDPGAVDFAARFEQECNILRELRHPCIVQFLVVVQDPNNRRPILLMELMEESLTMFLERSTVSLPFHIQVNITHDIAQALDYLHGSSILHRDLSSNNILLDADSKVKVTDFGMSMLMEANARMTRSKLTQCPGTPAFMPPEALRAKPRYSVKLDIFSLGVLIIQIITRTFPAPTEAERVMEDPSAPLGEKIILVPELERRKKDISQIPSDHSLLPIACHCLKDRDKERPTAEELCMELKHLKTDKVFMSSVAERQHTRISPEQKLKKEKEKKSGIAHLHAQRRQLTTDRRKITELTQQLQMSSPKDEKIDVEVSTPEGWRGMHLISEDLSSHHHTQLHLPSDVQHPVTSLPSRDPDDPPSPHSCPKSLSEMSSTSFHIDEVDIAGKTIECADLGFSIVFPQGTVTSPVKVSVCCSFKHEFSPPDGYEFVSPVYILHVHPETKFQKKVALSLQHWARSDGSDLLFASCPFPNINHLYRFKVMDGGDFTSRSHYGRVDVDHFSFKTITRKLRGALSRLWGGGENSYRASLVSPMSTERSVNAWHYVISLSLNHNIFKSNTQMWMEERYPDFKWRAEVLCVEFVSGKKTFTVKLDPVGVINIKGCNTIALKDIKDGCNNYNTYPPRVLLEAKQNNFTSCSVTIKGVKDLEHDCTFKLEEPTMIHDIEEMQGGTSPGILPQVSVPRDQKLGINDLVKVLKQIKNVTNKWNFLGLELGLKEPTLESINSHDYAECKKEMIKKWLKKEHPDCNPSWWSLADALRSPLVQHNDIAQEIQDKYLPRVETSV